MSKDAELYAAAFGAAIGSEGQKHEAALAALRLHIAGEFIARIKACAAADARRRIYGAKEHESRNLAAARRRA